MLDIQVPNDGIKISTVVAVQALLIALPLYFILTAMKEGEWSLHQFLASNLPLSLLSFLYYIYLSLIIYYVI